MRIEFKNLRLLFIMVAAMIGVPVLTFFLAFLFFRQLATEVVEISNDTELPYKLVDLYASADNGRLYQGTFQEVLPGERATFRSGGFVAMQCVLVEGVGDFYFDPSSVQSDRYANLVSTSTSKNLFGKEVTTTKVDLSKILLRTKSNPCPFDEGDAFTDGRFFEGDIVQTMDDKDIDADGTTDVITLTIVQAVDGRQAHLYLNTKHAIVPGGNPAGTFQVIDIDESVPGLEVAVMDEGPSGDFATRFYSYDKSGLKPIGTLPGNIEEMTFDGAGTVESTVRADMLDTWFFRDEYLLVNGAFIRQEKTYYPRLNEGEVRMRQMVQLAVSPTDEKIVGSLNAGDKATILGCDNVSWCMARSLGGVEGWFNADALDVYATFDGLSYAD